VKQGNTQGHLPKAILAVAFPLATLLVALALTLFAGLDFATAPAIVAAVTHRRLGAAFSARTSACPAPSRT
jgi:hypothetical protein